MTTRRQFLTVLGGGAIFAAAGCSTVPRTALAPWEIAPAERDPRRFALSHAILAPNPHNLQPWLVRLNDDGSATLFYDPTRALPETDPFDRQITIGLGCFLEQTKIAATAVGYRAEVDLFPQGWSQSGLDTRPVAEIAFVPSGMKDPLFDAIPERRSAKVPFDMAQPVPAAAFAQIDPGTQGVRFAGTVEAAEVTTLRALMWDAWVVEAETERTFQESVDLMRLGRREIDASPDGIDLGGGMMEGLVATGMVTREKLATPGTMAYQTGWDMYEEMLAATPSVVWMTTPGNTREDQIAGGAAWLRLNLLTTVNGLALHPVSQCLQEYPEMAPHYARAHTLLAERGETVQMLGRLGYAEPQPKTPRWSLDDKLVG